MTYGIEPHRSINILEQFLAEVIKREVGLTADLIKCAAGKIDTAPFAFTLDVGCDIYAVAKDVVALNDNITDIDGRLER